METQKLNFCLSDSQRYLQFCPEFLQYVQGLVALMAPHSGNGRNGARPGLENVTLCDLGYTRGLT